VDTTPFVATASSNPARRAYRRAPSPSLLAASDVDSVAVRWRADDGAFRALRERLRAVGVFAPCPGYYARKLAEVALLWIVGVAVLLAARGSRWVALDGVILAIASAQTVLLGHDAVHRAAFARGGKLGRVAQHLLMGLLAGASASWWRRSHNTHHLLSNDPARDPDIDYPFLAFDIAQARQKSAWAQAFLRRQHWLVWLLMPGVSVTLRFYSVCWLVRRVLRGERTARHASELAVMLLHWTLYVAVLATALPPTVALALAALHQVLFGTYLALITSSNHWGMPMPDAETLTFLEHQVQTSRNIRGGALVRFLFGGLDAQIEHHLFTALARPRLRDARPIVRAFCEEHGIAYVERAPLEAMKDVYASLRAVARKLSPRCAHAAEDHA